HALPRTVRAPTPSARRLVRRPPRARRLRRLRAVAVLRPRILWRQMTIADKLKDDVATAMKAREKVRVGALRMVLAELQKAAKEGSPDELAVLRRERKRRLEAERAFREGGRQDLADAERDEAELIGSYLPQ